MDEPMKCPYCVNSNTVQLTKYTYNDEDGNVSHDYTEAQEVREFVECLRDGCMAYYDGKCYYRGK